MSEFDEKTPNWLKKLLNSQNYINPRQVTRQQLDVTTVAGDQASAGQAASTEQGAATTADATQTVPVGRYPAGVPAGQYDGLPDAQLPSQAEVEGTDLPVI